MLGRFNITNISEFSSMSTQIGNTVRYFKVNERPKTAGLHLK